MAADRGFWRDRRGRLYQSGLGGTYRVNNGDPQCDVDAEDMPEDMAEDEGDADE